VSRVAVVLLAIASAAAAATVALAAQSPTQLRASIFAAARAKHSVHYVALTVSAFRMRIVGDVAGNRGIQKITFVKGSQSGHLTVKVVRRTAYLRGDAFTLHQYLGFTTSQASTYHGKWISIPSASPAHATIAAAVTFRSFLSELYPKGKNLVGVKGSVDGDHVVGVRVARRQAGLNVVTTLYARGHGTPLPLKRRELASGRGYSSSTTIGRWNEPVHVRAPAHAVPITRVAAS